MARYDKYTERNILTKNEKLIQKSVNFLLIISISDFISIFIRPIRNYHFNNFPNFYLVGISLIFLSTLVRTFQAKNEGKDDYMETSREWRERKDMLGPYDFYGPGPDYSNKIYNILYFIGVSLGTGLVILNLCKNCF